MKHRQLQLGTNVFISVAALFAVVVMLNYIGARHYRRFDWTSSQIYTLSPKTKSVVKQLHRKVTLYVLWSRTDPLFGHLEEVLAGYRELNNRIDVQTLDPDQDPEQFTMIQRKYGNMKVNEMGEAGVEAGVFVVCGDNVKFLPATSFSDYGDDLTQQSDTPSIRFKAEGELTSALIMLTATEKQTICFTEGHGEWAFEGSERDSLRHVKKDLTLDGFLSEAISLENGAVPKRCNAVVVAGPKHPFLESEAEALQNYFNGSGRLLLLLDPIFEKERFLNTGLEKLCAAAGIELRNDFVLETDPRRLVSETPVTFLADRFYTHESVKPLAGAASMPSPVIFSIVRSMKQSTQKDVIADILATTSAVSWGETNLASVQGGTTIPEQDSYDTEGPLVIAMAATRGTKNGKEAGRMVVVGDSDFLSEEAFINAGLYNQDFWSSLVGWLSARKELVAIDAKNPEQVQLLITDKDFANILFALILEVLLIGAIGITVIYRRRK
ncbi:MAG: GldG family protein [Deltaproteobacteria bacterium]|nr:GldG family protein [Deltaproteobacteria bacterium]MBN2670047.1 GldG family protein [Deltaproteobacteria bacterium]